jgi:hypothetical protein
MAETIQVKSKEIKTIEELKNVSISSDTVKVQYVSLWDGGTKIRTSALFDPIRNVVFDVEATDGEGVNTLDEEFIEFEDGTTKQVVYLSDIEKELSSPDAIQAFITDDSSVIHIYM